MDRNASSRKSTVAKKQSSGGGTGSSFTKKSTGASRASAPKTSLLHRLFGRRSDS